MKSAMALASSIEFEGCDTPCVAKMMGRKEADLNFRWLEMLVKAVFLKLSGTWQHQVGA